MQKLLSGFFNVFKNTLNYTIKGVFLVLLSYGFKFLTRWAIGALPELLLQFVIMSLGIFILDNLLYLILPSEISTTPTADCPPCDCNCKCECPTQIPSTPVVLQSTQDQPSGLENFKSY